MKLSKRNIALLSAYAFAAATVSAQSSVYSTNIVGYYNLDISHGDNLIANQLGSSPDNTLDSVLTAGVVAGSTFSEWDPASNQLLPASSYNGATWSINYTLGPDGTGGVLNSPSTAVVTLVGNVFNAILPVNGPPIYTFDPPNRGPGSYLLSLATPVQEDSTFLNIVGRAPHAGDSVVTLDGPTQIYSTNRFNGSAWSDGDPLLAVGQAAYFNLAPVPEPSALVLSGFSVTAFWIFRRRKTAI